MKQHTYAPDWLVYIWFHWIPHTHTHTKKRYLRIFSYFQGKILSLKRCCSFQPRIRQVIFDTFKTINAHIRNVIICVKHSLGYNWINTASLDGNRCQVKGCTEKDTGLILATLTTSNYHSWSWKNCLQRILVFKAALGKFSLYLP